MKSILKTLLVTGSFMALATGCQEKDVPVSDDAPNAALSDEGCPHIRPDPVCAPFVYQNIITSSGDAVGTVGMYSQYTNIAADIFLTGAYLGDDKGITRISAYAGSLPGIPLLPGGDMNPDLFPVDLQDPDLRCPGSIGIPVTFPTAIVVIRIEVSTFDFFGGSEVTDILWANGTAHRGGYYFDYVSEGCPLPVPVEMTPVDACQNIVPDITPSCVTFAVNITAGTAPFTYHWSTGQTDPTITLCGPAPTVGLTVTSAQGTTASTTFTINYLDAPCGNDNSKIQICKRPPGNPGGNTMCVPRATLANWLSASGSTLDGNGEYTIGPCGAEMPGCSGE